MKAYIYIHSQGSIVAKFVVEFDSLSDLDFYYQSAFQSFGLLPDFCFDVLIIGKEAL